jgi:hypothetical protein
MPPILIALGIAGLYFLIPKSQRAAQSTLVVTPHNTPIGITTGFAAPLPVNQNPLPTGGTTNRPSTAGSGVPNTAIQTQKAGPSIPSSPGVAEYYPNPNQVLMPRFNAVPVPTHSDSGGGCGCGSGGSDMHANQCSIERNRFANSGCLAPSQAQLVTKSDIPMLEKWLANLQSSPDASIFGAYQDVVASIARQNPVTDHVTPPVGHTDTHIGLTYRRPSRASL